MMIKDLYLFTVYSQIWLNLPRDDITFETCSLDDVIFEHLCMLEGHSGPKWT
jgi:hypothetical protein